MRATVLLSVLAMSCATVAPAGPQALSTAAPAFEWVVLGNLGGDSDQGLTSFLLGKPGEAPSLLVDAGSLVGGLVAWQQRLGLLSREAGPQAQAKVVQRALEPVQAVLLTHAHLDHWGGLVQASTLLLGLVQKGHASFELVSLPSTQEAVLGLFRSQVWADFTAIPKDRPTFVPVALPQGEARTTGGFSVRSVLLHHTIDSAGFFIERPEGVFLHLGDTGATTEVWEQARPSLEAHRLKAIAIEVSFPAAQEHLANVTGHLTRNSLLLELNALARAQASVPTAETMTDAQALALAKALAPHFAACPILAIHVKALAYDAVAKELAGLREVGLNLVLPEVGQTYRF